MKVEIGSVAAFEILRHMEAESAWYISGILIGEMKEEGILAVSGSHPRVKSAQVSHILEYYRNMNPSTQILGRYRVVREGPEDEEDVEWTTGSLEVFYDHENGFRGQYEGEKVEVVLCPTPLDRCFIESVGAQVLSSFSG